MPTPSQLPAVAVSVRQGSKEAWGLRMDNVLLPELLAIVVIWINGWLGDIDQFSSKWDSPSELIYIICSMAIQLL